MYGIGQDGTLMYIKVNGESTQMRFLKSSANMQQRLTEYLMTMFLLDVVVVVFN